MKVTITQWDGFSDTSGCLRTDSLDSSKNKIKARKLRAPLTNVYLRQLKIYPCVFSAFNYASHCIGSQRPWQNNFCFTLNCKCTDLYLPNLWARHRTLWLRTFITEQTLNSQTANCIRCAFRSNFHLNTRQTAVWRVCLQLFHIYQNGTEKISVLLNKWLASRIGIFGRKYNFMIEHSIATRDLPGFLPSI